MAGRCGWPNRSSAVWLPMNALGAAVPAGGLPPAGGVYPGPSRRTVNVTDSEERSDEENRILSGIVSFGSKDVKQIMTPRTDVTAFAQDLSWSTCAEDLAECGFDRVPRRGLDQVKGILYAKDIPCPIQTAMPSIGPTCCANPISSRKTGSSRRTCFGTSSASRSTSPL